MDIKIEKQDDVLKVTVSGRLDTTTSPELEEKLDPELGSAKKIIFDFADLDYISSAGLRVLLKAAQSMDDMSDIKVINVNEDIMGIFEVTGFTDILTIE